MDGESPPPPPPLRPRRAPWLDAYRWRPGQSGNPGGRPKGESLLAKLRAVLECDQVDGHQLDGDVGDLVVRRLVQLAIEGDGRLLRFLFEVTIGRPRQAEAGPTKVQARDAWSQLARDLGLEEGLDPSPGQAGGVPGADPPAEALE
jgi:hypothetical protein